MTKSNKKEKTINFSDTSLNIISQSQILTEEDLHKIRELQFELKDVFLNTQIFRTRTEMEVSVLNDLKFPTPDSKYWQAVREQNVMFQELVMLSYEYRKNIVEIKKLERDMVKEKDKLEKELLKIETEKKTFISLNQARTAKDRIRELMEWSEIKEKFIPDIKYGLKNANDHQLVSYAKRFVGEYLAMKDKGSPSERANLIGQLEMALKICRQRGLLDKVLPKNSPEHKMFLKED